MRLTAGTETWKLVNALEKAGWGDLAANDLKGVVKVLPALARALPAKSGQGVATVEQIAARANLSKRWTADRLGVLEALDLVVWHRGGVKAGKPSPSWFRINRVRLLALVQAARGIRDAALAALHRQTTERLRGLRMLTVRSRRSSKYARIAAGHAQVEGATSLPPDGEDSRPSPRAVPLETSASECEHGVSTAVRTASGAPGCPICRRTAARG